MARDTNSGVPIDNGPSSTEDSNKKTNSLRGSDDFLYALFETTLKQRPAAATVVPSNRQDKEIAGEDIPAIDVNVRISLLLLLIHIC